MSENEPLDLCPAKIQLSLRICPVWSESSLDTFCKAKDAEFLLADNGDSIRTQLFKASLASRAH